MLWSVLYILAGIASAIYELTLGGNQLLEVTLVPVLYIIVFSLWIYSVWCIKAYFQSVQRRPRPNSIEGGEEFESVKLALTNSIRRNHSKRIYPRPIWESPLLVQKQNHGVSGGIIRQNTTSTRV